MDEQKAVFEVPLRIPYVPPRWLLPYLIISGSGAIVCLISLNLIWPLKAFLVLLVGAVLIRSDFRQITRQQSGLVLDAKDRWFIIVAGKSGVPARLVQASITLPGFIVLVLQTADEKKFRFFLTAENLDSTTMRRLRIRLYYPKVRTD